MKYIEKHFGFSTADAEDVQLQFINCDLTLTFTDWQEKKQQIFFRNILAFCWQEPDETDIRDDETYEVTDSSWLEQQAKLQDVLAQKYAHYKLCFNAIGTLDVLASRI
ncbi:MAG TPA: hypothetical protein VIH42_07925 [Thermoguttaceae bacterium]